MFFYVLFIYLFLLGTSERTIASYSNPSYYRREIDEMIFNGIASSQIAEYEKGADLYCAIMGNDVIAFNQALQQADTDILKFRNYPRNETLAHVALSRNRHKMFKKIVQKAVDCNVIMDDQFKLVSAVNAQKEVIEVKQFESVPFIDAQQCQGTTLVHYAVNHQRIAYIKFLHQHGADFQKINKEGQTPLELAEKMERNAKARLKALETKGFSRFGRITTPKEVRCTTHVVAAVKACIEDSNKMKVDASADFAENLEQCVIVGLQGLKTKESPQLQQRSTKTIKDVQCRADIATAITEYIEQDATNSTEISPLRKSRKLDNLTLIVDRS